MTHPASNRNRDNPPPWLKKNACLLGTDVKSKRPVYLPDQVRSQGTALVGASGTGKTVLLEQMAWTAAWQNHGFAIIEPHGDLSHAVLSIIPEHRMRDVILLDMQDWRAPFSINPFECDDPTNSYEVTKTTSFLMHAFAAVWQARTEETPQLAMVLRHATRALIEAQATLDAMPLLFWDDHARERLLSRVRNPQTRLFWQQYGRKSLRDRDALVASTANKIDSLLANPLLTNIFCQKRSSISFRKLMDEGRILIVLLSPLLEEASRLVGALLISKILLAAFSRADTPERRRREFDLLLDEQPRFSSADTAILLAEARKFALRPCIALQSLAQISRENQVMVQSAGTLIIFRVTGEDAKELSLNFDTSPTNMEVIGEEPIRAPVSDVVGHLVRRGHNNPEIAAFTAQYLMPLEALLQKVGNTHLPFQLGCTLLRRGHLIEARRLVNDVLFESMQTGRSDGFIPPLALFVLGGAADDGITNVFFDDIKHDLLFSGAEFMGFKASADRFGQGAFLKDQKKVDQLLTIHAKKKVWDDIFVSRIVHPGPAFIRMLQVWRQTLANLARHPILVDTGQYRPKYQLRTYSDMAGEISNELSTMENFHAKVRLPSGEHVIRTHPAPQGLTGERFTTRLCRIKQQMHFLGYVRGYREVAHEIAKRQKHWQAGTGSDDPPPRHT